MTRRLRSILQAALEMEPGQRTVFIRQACAGQDELRRQVEHQLEESLRFPPTRISGDSVTWVTGEKPEEPSLHFGAGDKLLHYEIISKLGQGGMGVVFRARDTRLLREVALKVLPPAPGSDADRRRRFLREAQAASQLNHPNIVTIYDVAEGGGVNFIAMEYVEGQTLASALPLEREEVLGCASQILSALAKAHAAGITHRDLKPANIMLTPDGQAKVLDFGLAKQMVPGPSSDQTMTQISQAASILGTPAYMSPEQAEGKPIDARSDIFSFGAVLYEMLSGKRAFQGQTAVSILAAVLRDEPRPLRELVPDIWVELEDVVARCLRKDKTTRFQSSAEVLRELQAAFRQRTQGGKEKVPAIAVLPFANMSMEKENEYFSDGLAEEIINALSRLPELKVTARTSAFAFKGKSVSIPEVAASLGVGHVLEGSVRKAGNRIRITAQLIAARDGSHVWSERYDRELQDIFAVQDEISQAIVNALKVSLFRAEPIVRAATTSMEAYQAYLEGRYYLYQFTPDAMERCRQLLERAIGLDPSYALPHAALAEYYYYHVGLHGKRPHDYMPQALAEAERAIELDPAAPDAYITRAMVRTIYQYDWDGAAEDFAKGLYLNPSSAIARYRLAYFYLRPLGRHEEAMAESARALELDPLSLLVRFGAANLSFMLEEYDKAVKQAHAALELFPNSWLGCWLSGQIFSYLGLFKEADEVLQKGLRILPKNALLLATLAMLRNYEGRNEEAGAIRAELEAMAAEGYISPCAIYVSYIFAQDVEHAYQRLKFAIEQRDPFAASTMFNFSKVFGDQPQYQRLRRMLNLPE
ncbi:MAG: protein kinase [Bryobacteraceae bacterium]